MKKNKTIAYMLAATLLVGGTFVGTKALFTDRIDEIGGLTISTGDVDIAVTNVPQWNITRNGGNDSDKNWGTIDNKELVEDRVTFDNLKYGDIITKTIQIENVGTLNAKVSLDEKILEGKSKIIGEDGYLLNNDGTSTNGIKFDTTFTYTSNENGGSTISSTDIGTNKEQVFKPGDKGTITFKIYVEKGGLHGNSINNDTQEAKIIDLAEAYILNAKQLGSDNITFN